MSSNNIQYCVDTSGNSCDWKNTLRQVESTVIQRIDQYRDETKQSIKLIDERHEQARIRLEAKINEELNKGTNRFIGIASDLGEIKAALNVKASKLEVVDDIREAIEIEQAERERIRVASQKRYEKVMWLIFGMMSSGLISLAIHIITK